MKSRNWLWVPVLGLAGLYYRFDPARYSFFPPCPFRWLTGYQCAGCGSQRAAHQLLHGHLANAWHINPLLVLLLPYLLLGFLLEYGPPWSQKELLRRRLYGLTAIRIVFAGIAVFWVGRNL